MVRGVLWDVGNVIVRWDPRNLYRQIFDDTAVMEQFLAAVCTPEWNLRGDRGESFADLIAEASAFCPEHADRIALWDSRWTDMLDGTIDETVCAIEALHARGVPQFGLTNMERGCWPRCRATSPAFGRLAHVVVSGEEGMVKPDPRLYAILLERTGFTAQDLLFIDDNPDNIATARALGFDTHLFDDPSTLLPALRARGLL